MKATAAAAAPIVASFFNPGLPASASAGGPQELETPHEIELRFRGGMIVVLAADLLNGGGGRDSWTRTGGGSDGAAASAAGGMGDAGIGEMRSVRCVARGGGGVTSRG